MLTNGNRKLGKNIFNFNIPRSTCVGRTPLCEKYCYAKKGSFQFPNVQRCMQENLDSSMQPDFAEQVKAQISNLPSLKYVRLHASGEFYNQEYFNKWNEVAKANPKITFLAYTKNTEIDFSQRSSNFKIYFSKDDSTTKMNSSLSLTAYVFNSGLCENKHMKYIKELNAFVCNSKCRECTFCFNSNKNVGFQMRR
jgi:hypothetical protein